MNFSNINLGLNVEIDPTTSINNVIIGDRVKIAKRCSIYGGPNNLLELGANSYVGMNTIINGFVEKIVIGKNVSISQFVNIMDDSGPNASPGMLRVFPIEKGPINIGNDCWIGASAIIMPNVTLGEYCVVAANSFVNKSFPAFSIIGGTPARLIRSFTEEEKEIMLNKLDKTRSVDQSEYEKNYIDLPFEDILREYRKNKILETVKKYPHGRFLEIGCGADPLFMHVDSFEKMVVVEPGKVFCELAHSMAKTIPNVFIINDVIENVVHQLKKETFDFIVVGGFLHEIDNPDKVLKAIRELCTDNTVVYSFVPNAKSFHRLLALEMGLIDNIYQKSGHDALFNRQNVYDIDSFNALLIANKFKLYDSGSYFVKPFTHDQMDDLMNRGIIRKNILDGLDKMIEHMPDMGTEIWNICRKND